MTESVKSYAQAAGAMRDTTKWIVALVPGAGTVLVVADLVPDWTSGSLDAAGTWKVTALLVAAAVAVAVLVVLALGVLRTDIAGWADVRKRLNTEDATDTKTLRFAIGASGILPLLGFQDVAAVSKAIGKQTDPDPVRAANAAVDFADYKTTADAFTRFLAVSGICVVVIAVCVAGASSVVSDAANAISEPTNVMVHLIDPSAALPGCEPSNEPIPGVAVAGTWVAPEVIVRAGSCTGTRLTVTEDLGFTAPDG